MKINFWNKKNRIPLILAPMAGITHAGFRILIKTYEEADIYFSEMLSCTAVTQKSPYSFYYLSTLPDPDRLIFQLLGCEQGEFEDAVDSLKEFEFAGIDINMGCSAPEIIKRRAGVRWMNDREDSRKLVAALRKKLPDHNLSVKIRLGETDDPDILLDFVLCLEAEGLDFITLHPRTRKEKFKKTARWEYVSLLKKHLKIPVIGNGDVLSWQDYKRVTEKYEPNGVMVGRGIIQKPWLFHHIREKEKNPDHITEINLVECYKRFFSLLYQYQPEDYYPSRTKRFFSYFCKNLLYGHGLQTKIQIAPSWQQMEAVVESYFDAHPEYMIYLEK